MHTILKKIGTRAILIRFKARQNRSGLAQGDEKEHRTSGSDLQDVNMDRALDAEKQKRMNFDCPSCPRSKLGLRNSLEKSVELQEKTPRATIDHATQRTPRARVCVFRTVIQSAQLHRDCISRRVSKQKRVTVRPLQIRSDSPVYRCPGAASSRPGHDNARHESPLDPRDRMSRSMVVILIACGELKEEASACRLTGDQEVRCAEAQSVQYSAGSVLV